MMDTIKQQEEEIKQLKSRLEKSVEVFKEQQKTINELRELVKKYYIDEWNGFKWLRNEFKEGDSVVVKITTDGKKNIEYRLVEGELKSVPAMVEKTVVDEITPIITDMENRFTEALNQEKTNREDAYMFKNVLDKLKEHSEIFSLVSTATFNGFGK